MCRPRSCCLHFSLSVAAVACNGEGPVECVYARAFVVLRPCVSASVYLSHSLLPAMHGTNKGNQGTELALLPLQDPSNLLYIAPICSILHIATWTG